jgi:hypothetical protein
MGNRVGLIPWGSPIGVAVTRNVKRWNGHLLRLPTAQAIPSFGQCCDTS